MVNFSEISYEINFFHTFGNPSFTLHKILFLFIVFRKKLNLVGEKRLKKNGFSSRFQLTFSKFYTTSKLKKIKFWTQLCQSDFKFSNSFRLISKIRLKKSFFVGGLPAKFQLNRSENRDVMNFYYEILPYKIWTQSAQ